MTTHSAKKAAAIVLCAAVLAAMPPRYGYSMSTLKTWVNKVRPGTFPELETAGRQNATQEGAASEKQESLTETERQILLSLSERKRQLDERDSQLNQREEQMRVLRDNIQSQVTELKRLQGEIEASMDAKKALDAENLKKVVAFYSGMDPKRAAEKFQTLDVKVSVQILMSMNQRKAAALLEQLPPETAKRVTEEIVRKAPVAN